MSSIRDCTRRALLALIHATAPTATSRTTTTPKTLTPTLILMALPAADDPTSESRRPFTLRFWCRVGEARAASVRTDGEPVRTEGVNGSWGCGTSGWDT